MSRVILARGIKSNSWNSRSPMRRRKSYPLIMRCATGKQTSDDDDEPDADTSERRRSTLTLPLELEKSKAHGSPVSSVFQLQSSPEVQQSSPEVHESFLEAQQTLPEEHEPLADIDEISPENHVNEEHHYSIVHAIQMWLQHWSANPEGKVMFYWKGFLTLTVIYNSVVVIMRTAFSELRDENLFTWLDNIGDLVYLLDIYIDSKTSYLQNGCVITDPRLMLKNYLGKNHFVNDIVSILPIQLVYTVATVFLHIVGSEMMSGSKIGRFLNCYQPVLRLNRLVKCHAMSSFFHRTESRTNSPNLLRAFRLGLQLALVIHWIACLYYMLSEYEGHGSTEWTYPIGPGFDNFYKKYIICMYWSTMTLTTIGERPSPSTDVEYVFTGFTFMVGVFVFAAVVGNVGDVISNMNAARRDFQSRMDQIKFYLNHRDVPEHLQTRIKRWAEYTWDRTKAIDEQSVLQLLPDRLRTEVAIHVHLNVLKKVSIFAECEEGLLRELVLKLRPQIFSPGDYICRIGEIGREMYIINHGEVEILFPDSETNAMRRVAVMHPGNFFGEISLLKLDDGQNKRTADVRSVGFSELLCLSRRDLMLALTEYPEAKRILEEYAKERFRQTKKHADETDESRDGSRRASTASVGSPQQSASQVFARVMKREGFSRLLQRKDTDLMAIKAAVEELKASKSAEIQENFVLMKRRIQELNRALMERSVLLQEAYSHIEYLKTVNNRLYQNVSNSPDLNSPRNNPTDSIPILYDFQFPKIQHQTHGETKCPIGGGNHFDYDHNHVVPPFVSDEIFSNFSARDQLDAPTMGSADLRQLRRASFSYMHFGHQPPFVSSDPGMSPPVDENKTFLSLSEDDDDSDDIDMDSLERKFDDIGKEDKFLTRSDGWQRQMSLPQMQPKKIHHFARSQTYSEDICDANSCEITPMRLESHYRKLSQSLTAIHSVEDVSKSHDWISHLEFAAEKNALHHPNQSRRRNLSNSNSSLRIGIENGSTKCIPANNMSVTSTEDNSGTSTKSNNMPTQMSKRSEGGGGEE